MPPESVNPTSDDDRESPDSRSDAPGSDRHQPQFNPHEPTMAFDSKGAVSEEESTEIPSHLGRYEIHGLLGKGAFGEVYLGVDPQLGRKVAIKVPRHFASGVQHEAFMREARRVAQLRHPSIVSIFDVGEFEDRCYFVSDYLAGSNLSDWMTQVSYSWQHAVRITSQLADALAHAHAAGTVHRDIKPSNIIVTSEGRPVLLDFGLAISDDEGRELPGVIAGTPSYMSPEQIHGKAHRIDGRTDIFSLGVLLYHMLAGKKPFRADNLSELMRQITEDEPQPLRQINPQLPETLDAVCGRAMAKKPAERYHTASDLAQALQQVLSEHGKETEQSALSAREEEAAREGGSTSRGGTTSTRRIYQAERRQVTGLFVFLDDAPLTSGDLDPEEFREIVQEVNKVCLKIATDRGGHVGQSRSEGMLVYFGYPVSFEGVQRRALTAGLDMVEAVNALLNRLKRTHPTIPDFAIGVYSGTVVAEDTGSTESFSRYSIIGNVSKMAAAVAQLADPGTLAASGQVCRLAGDAFEFERLDRQLPGKASSGDLDVFRVVRQLAAGDSNAGEGAEHRNCIVGRDHELGLLAERWQLVKEGHGQIVLIGAEPGVGKSRLLEEFSGSTKEGTEQLNARCSPFHQTTALYPIISVLEQLMQTDSANGDTRLAALESLCDRVQLPRQDGVPLLSELLSIPMGAKYRVFEGTPERRKQQTLELLVELILLLCEDKPLLFLVEDLHWIDPTTQDFLSLLLEHAGQMPCLVLLTYRPEFVVPWGARPNQIQFMLSQFNEQQTRELATAVAGGNKLPDDVLGEIAAKTDGVPLYIEEMTKALLESDALELDGDEYRLRQPLESLSIPTTLQDSLMARLDRLKGAKEVAQLGAILGREFTYQLIRSVAPLEEAELRHELSALVEAELLYQRGFFPRTRFTFKHALVQDVAYDSLLRKTRQEWHGRIATVMESDFPQLVESEPELLAHHFGEGGEFAKGAEYWFRAGIRAQEQSALPEALQVFQKGLALVESIEDDDEREQLEFRFQIPLGVTLLGLQGYASPDVGPVFERANHLATRFGGVFERFHILWGTWAWRVVREELDQCVELGQQAEALIAGENDPGLQMESLFIPGLTLFYKGEFARSRDACTQGYALYDEERCRLHARHTGQNSGVTHQCYGALSLWHLGFPEQAEATARNAVALARAIEHPFSLAYALHHQGWLQQHLRNTEQVLACADETLALAAEQGFIFWIAEGHLCRGYGRFLEGRYAEAEQSIQEGLKIFQMSGAALSLSHFYTMLSKIRLAQGDRDGALDWIRQAHEACERFGNEFHLSEIHRCHADILLPGSPDEAERQLQQALTVARRQEALSCELRATVSLARLRQSQHRDPDAVAMLDDVCGRFEEGTETHDFREAVGLAGELRA